MLDLFQPPTPPAPLNARRVLLLDAAGEVVNEYKKPNRLATAPRAKVAAKPRKPYKRTPEQNRAKNQRYIERHGREYVQAMQRHWYAERRDEILAAKHARYATDPAFRRMKLESAARSRAKRKAKGAANA